MIAMVVDSKYRCLLMSDIPPIYKSDGHSADDYTGCDTLEHVSEGKQEWVAAIDHCLMLSHWDLLAPADECMPNFSDIQKRTVDTLLAA